MKKLLLVLLSSVLISPLYAQGDKVVRTGIKFATQSELALRVAQKVGQRAVPIPVTNFALAQIANLPGQPTVKVQLPQHAAQTTAVLPARVLPPVEGRKIIFSASGLYVPGKLNSRNKFIYRGMELHTLPEVENLLREGLELSKSHYDEGIYTTYDLKDAFRYAFPSARYAKTSGTTIPVLVSILYPREMKGKYLFYEYSDTYVCDRDIPAKYIEDIMVFLEINGKPGWYKVILKNNEVLFVPVIGVRIRN